MDGTENTWCPGCLRIAAGGVRIHRAACAAPLLGHVSPGFVAAGGLLLAAGGAFWLSTAPAEALFAADLLPGHAAVGIRYRPFFMAGSVTAMTGIPFQQAGMASGFLMTGHEIGAALGVAVLAAVATDAGDLTTPAGAAPGFTGGSWQPRGSPPV